MKNLLPQEEIKRQKRSYLIRLVVIFGTLSAGAFSLGVALLVPPFIITQMKAEGLKGQLEVGKKEIDIENKKTEREALNRIKKEIEALGNFENKASIYDILDTIVGLRQTGIKLNVLSYENRSANERVISARGIAATRRDLIGFRDRLAREKYWKEVELPISDLAQNQNIEFSILLKGVVKSLNQ